MSTAQRPSDFLKDKTNVIPSLNRDQEATAEDFIEIAEILDNHAIIIDDITLNKTSSGGYTGTSQDLKNSIDLINAVLTSDESTLDELQEIVDFIQQNKSDLDNLTISNIAGLQNALDGKLDLTGGIINGELVVQGAYIKASGGLDMDSRSIINGGNSDFTSIKIGANNTIADAGNNGLSLTTQYGGQDLTMYMGHIGSNFWGFQLPLTGAKFGFLDDVYFFNSTRLYMQGGDIDLSSGNITLSNGSVTATNFIGDGSQLTNLPIPSLPSNLAYKDVDNIFSVAQSFTANNPIKIIKTSNANLSMSFEGSSITKYLGFTNGTLYVSDSGILNSGNEIYHEGNLTNVAHTNIDNSFTGIQTFNAGLRVSDNVFLRIGNNDDLRLHHDGTNNYIDNYTNNLFIRNRVNGGDTYFQAEDNSGVAQTLIKLKGTEGTVSLAYGNVDKLATSLSGVDITGSVTATAFGKFGNVTVKNNILEFDRDGTVYLDNPVGTSSSMSIRLGASHTTIANFNQTQATFYKDIYVGGGNLIKSVTSGADGGYQLQRSGYDTWQFRHFDGALTFYNHTNASKVLQLTNTDADFIVDVNVDGTISATNSYGTGKLYGHTLTLGRNTTNYIKTDQVGGQLAFVTNGEALGNYSLILKANGDGQFRNNLIVDGSINSLSDLDITNDIFTGGSYHIDGYKIIDKVTDLSIGAVDGDDFKVLIHGRNDSSTIALDDDEILLTASNVEVEGNIQADNYKSSDGSTGGTVVDLDMSLVDKITFKNGLYVSHTLLPI